MAATDATLPVDVAMIWVYDHHESDGKRPLLERGVRAYFHRHSLSDEGIAMARIRSSLHLDYQWPGQNRGMTHVIPHLTVDFCNASGIRQRTEHVYFFNQARPIWRAYGWFAIGNQDSQTHANETAGDGRQVRRRTNIFEFLEEEEA